ncbi:MAG: pectinacetylesterase family protein [Myxococcales bacterium]|nr:pectinacetylesterase family protein [Myxococcales bacterium]
MDGTPAAFYYDAAATSSSDWVVILQGSNLCKDVVAGDGTEAGTVEACEHWCFMNQGGGPVTADPTGSTDDSLAGGTDGLCDHANASSSFWGATATKGGLFDDGAINPAFQDAQKIWVRSCSGDGWMGTADTVASSGAVATSLTDLDFQGQLIIDEVFSELMAGATGQTLDADDRVIFGGESRGAVGAWANLDRVCDDLLTNPGVEGCAGVTASYFGALYKPPLREEAGLPVQSQTWNQWVDRRALRYAYQGISHPSECTNAYPDAVSLSPTTSYELDLADTSSQMCYTETGLLLSVTSPLFVSYNRLDYNGVFEWDAGCSAGPAECYNNQLAREQGIDTLLAAMPASSGSYVTASDLHLYMVAPSCSDPLGGCWTDANCVQQGSSCAATSTSKAEAFRDWLLGLHTDVHWDIERK